MVTRRQTGGMPMPDDSFAAAYTQYLPAVSSYLSRRVERAAIEDLAADVFAVAWRKRATVPAGFELPWLYRTASYLVANHRRRAATGFALVALLRSADSAPSAEDIVIGDMSLAGAWRELRAKDREVLALSVFEDLPISSIAIALEISSNAASIRLHRAKRSLAALLSEPKISASSERVASEPT